MKRAIRTAATLIVCGTFGLMLVACAPVPQKAEILPVSSVNYNNYINGNLVDCRDGYLALYRYGVIRNTLVLYDGEGIVTTVSNADEGFQIFRKQLFYVKNNKLKAFDIPSGQTTEIAKNVAAFIVHTDGIYYLTEPGPESDSWLGSVQKYDWGTKSHRTVYENVRQFYVYSDTLYLMDGEDALIEISPSGEARELVQFQPAVYPYTVAAQGKKLLSIGANDDLLILDTATGEKRTISIQEGTYSNNRIHFVCDDTRTFVSFQATQTNGSVVTDRDSELNGVWQIDIDTQTKRKVCDTYFESLYLCDGVLMGVKDNGLYRIDMDTGEIQSLV